MLTASGAILIAKNYSPGIVLPAIGVASVMVGVLFGAQVFSAAAGRRTRRAPAGAARLSACAAICRLPRRR